MLPVDISRDYEVILTVKVTSNEALPLCYVTGQFVLSGMLPVMGGRGQECRKCRRLAKVRMVLKVCMEEGVGFVDMWLSFVGRDAQRELTEKTQRSTNKHPKKCSSIISKKLKCVCLYARSMVNRKPILTLML